MTPQHIKDNAPAQDMKLHYMISKYNDVYYFYPDKNLPCDLVYDAEKQEWVMWNCAEYGGRIEFNKNIKPVFTWEIL